VASSKRERERERETRTIDIVNKKYYHTDYFNEILLSLRLFYCATITIIAIALILILRYITITFARAGHYHHHHHHFSLFVVQTTVQKLFIMLIHNLTRATADDCGRLRRKFDWNGRKKKEEERKRERDDDDEICTYVFMYYLLTSNIMTSYLGRMLKL